MAAFPHAHILEPPQFHPKHNRSVDLPSTPTFVALPAPTECLPHSHSPNVTISPASPSDYSSLAIILPLANATNPIERFMFRPDHRHSSQQWALTQFRDAQKFKAGTTTHILKAAAAESGQAVGFAIIRVFEHEHDQKGVEEKDDSKAAVSPENSGREADADDILNHEFCDVYLTRLKEIYERHMSGQKHAYWSTLMVLPSWQGCGVGSAIIRWALEDLKLKTMPVYLTAQPDGHRLYQKLGWKDVETVDIDLSEYAGPNRGYGMHRTVCMLREPSVGSVEV